MDKWPWFMYKNADSHIVCSGQILKPPKEVNRKSSFKEVLHNNEDTCRPHIYIYIFFFIMYTYIQYIIHIADIMQS